MMEFVRKIISSNDIESIIKLPEELKNKKVEILILPIEEEVIKKEFNPEEYRGVMDIKLDELDKELKNMRDEWERF